METWIIADPAMASALRAGRKTQFRIPLGASPGPVPGDRILVREAAMGGRMKDGRPIGTGRRSAEFVVFADGWRQHRDGRGHAGPRLDGDRFQWIAAIHLPDWAVRMVMTVEWVRHERLQAIGASDIRAEGAVPLLGGLLWRWPKPVPGLYRSARAAFAHYWDVARGGEGTCWADDPEVVVIGFSVTPK